MQGAMVDIEVDVASSLPGIVIIGLPDTALGEARERVRSAASNSGCALPAKRFTVNLSPAALPKHGSGFDLGIALAMLAATKVVTAESVASVVHIGELGLDGRVRAVPGMLPAVLAARAAGAKRVMVSIDGAGEASLVDGIEVIPARSLRDAARLHGARFDQPAPIELDDPPAAAPADVVPDDTEEAGDLADVLGNDEAVQALLVAAAGGHHLFMVGPPGAGKTMLASRLPGILPDLDLDAAIEVACVRSLGALPVRGLPTRPPFESPHHTASAVALVGGGSGVIRPGAISRAANGVLFLDDRNRSATTTNEAPDSGWSRGNAEAASLIVVEVSKSPRASLAVVTLIDIVL
jgi:magnesium chelatase family protein